MGLLLSRRVVAAAVALAWFAGAAVVAADGVSPRQAIERAVFDRLGGGVLQVEVGAVATTVEAQPALVAVPDPGGFVGRSVRFALTVNGRRQGVAVTTVRVRARVARTVRAIERDQLVEADDVTMVEDDLNDVRFLRLPRLEDIVGSRARRDLSPGVVITRGMVAAPLDVRNGERVTVGVTIGRVHVTGEGVASGSGHIGDVVHVVPAGRRGLLKGRITEPGAVEVVP